MLMPKLAAYAMADPVLRVTADNTQAVHTTGVNWQSVIVIVASIVTILSLLGAAVGKYVANRVTGAINEFQIAVVQKLDTRLVAVEGKLDEISVNNPRYPADQRERSRRGKL
jgi:hypothetical protein